MTEYQQIREDPDEAYNKEVIVKTKEVLEKESVTSPLLTEHEKELRKDNLLEIKRYEGNAYRLGLSINKPDPEADDPHKRLEIFDRLMDKIRKAGIKVHHHGSDDEKIGPGFTYWEFMVGTSYYHQALPDQATVLEIAEMIAKKIGVELEL